MPNPGVVGQMIAETCKLDPDNGVYRHVVDGSVIPLKEARKNPSCAKFPESAEVLAAMIRNFRNSHRQPEAIRAGS
jgi:hypothetical protein